MTPLGLPFEHLNLRVNPFGELPYDVRARVGVVDVERFVEPLRKPGFCVQFLGDAGRGKTTHLLKLLLEFPDAMYVHLPEDEPPPPIPEGPVVFVDETQRLTRRARARLFGRPGASFVLGTHEDHSRELERAGLRYETVRVGGAPSREDLRRILSARIEDARRGSGPLPTFSDAGLDRLIARFGDDIRGLEHYLYEVFQELTEVGVVEV